MLMDWNLLGIEGKNYFTRSGRNRHSYFPMNIEINEETTITIFFSHYFHSLFLSLWMFLEVQMVSQDKMIISVGD